MAGGAALDRATALAREDERYAQCLVIVDDVCATAPENEKEECVATGQQACADVILQGNFNLIEY